MAAYVRFNFVKRGLSSLMLGKNLCMKQIQVGWYSVSASKLPTDVSTQLVNGLLLVTMVLPSRQERCQFSFRPVGQTLGDVLNSIQEEDKGIERLAAYLPDGDRLARSTPLHTLLAREFHIHINDLVFAVNPASQILAGTHEHMQQLSDLQNIIRQLYITSGSDQLYQEQERKLLCTMESLKSQLAPLEETKQSLEKVAEKRTIVLKWLGLGLMAVQFGVLARLTWWEYSWDVMEPVTYFVGYGTAIAMFAYYVVTKQEYTFPEVRDREFLLTLHRRAKKVNFDIQQYNDLKEKLSRVEYDLQRLRDPLQLHLPISQQQLASN